MASMTMVIVCIMFIAARSRFRLERTLLIFSGFENESKDTCGQHEHSRKNGNLHSE